MTKTHDDEAEAVKALSDRVNMVIGGRWLGVIVNIDDEGIVHLFRNTWQFPHNKYIDVVGLLATDLSRDVPNPPSVQQISMEDFLSLQKKLQEKDTQVASPLRQSPLGPYHDVVQDEMRIPMLRDDDPIHVSPEDLADKVVADINRLLDEEGPV